MFLLFLNSFFHNIDDFNQINELTNFSSMAATFPGLFSKLLTFSNK